MARKLADGTEEKFAGTESIRPLCRKEFVTFRMSFEFAEESLLK